MTKSYASTRSLHLLFCSLRQSHTIQLRSIWIVSALFLISPYTKASRSQLTFVWTPNSRSSNQYLAVKYSGSKGSVSTSKRFLTSSSLNMAKLESPSAQRNKGPIWEILSQKVFATFSPNKPLRILEIAAGSGVHVDHFATQLNSISKVPFTWYPTDPDLPSRNSIESYLEDDDGKLKAIGVQSPMQLTLDENGITEASTADVLSGDDESLDMIICINMIHISPWEATLGLMKFAGERLEPDCGVLYCYGPYKEGGTAAPSNLNFDENLKSRDPSWGIRDLEEVKKAALQEGMNLMEKIEMPANNLSLMFRKETGKEK